MSDDPRFNGEHDLRVPKIAGYYRLEDVSHICGGVSSATAITLANAEKALNFYYRTTAVAGDVRALYLRLYFGAAGTVGGEAIRAFATVEAAVSGTVNAIHASTSFTAAGSESGQASGIRVALEAAAATRTLTGTYTVLQLDSIIAAGNTVNGQKVSFIRCCDLGAVKMPYFLDLDGLTAGTDGAFETDTGAVGTPAGYLRVITPAGAVGYIVVYGDHS